LHLAEYAAVEREMTVRRFAEDRSSVPLEFTSPVYQREFQRILEGLRRAGMPDGVDARPLGDPDTIRPDPARGSAGDLSQPVSELIGRETELSSSPWRASCSHRCALGLTQHGKSPHPA
jgi:hypothetical protein